MEKITRNHEYYMKLALKEAKKAYKLGEVPIGCVIVYKDEIIGKGYNRRNTDTGSGHTDGLWWVPKMLMRQITPVEEEGQSGLGPTCPIGPSFSPGTSSPSHCGHLWG